jgi:F0F1-type ATP synthase assembly protein I
LLGKYNVEKEENLDQVIEELKQKVLAKTQKFSSNKKDKTSTVNIKCVEQTARNFTTFL